MAYGGVVRFSEVLKTASENSSFKNGCIVDTSILFAASYTPDEFNQESEELFDFLAELEIPIYANVNIRSEFIDQHRRVMIPEGLSDLFSSFGRSLDSVLYTKLQSVSTSLSLARQNGKPYKFDDNQIKKWRLLLKNYRLENKEGWIKFCSDFLQGKIEAIWAKACEELAVNTLTLRKDDQPEWLEGNLNWENMASLVGKFGIGSFDEMIINLFLESKFSGLITADRDIAYVIENLKPDRKYVVVPDRLNL
jgi:hypothetical protein